MNIFKKLFDHEYKELKKFNELAEKIIDLDEEYIDILVDDFLNDIDDSPEVEDSDDDENDYWLYEDNLN